MNGSNKLISVGIKLGQEFDGASYEAIRQKMLGYREDHPVALRLFKAAWKGLAYRYRAVAESNEIFTAFIPKINSFTPDQRYYQDHALFTFSFCALSTLECFCFGAHCFASVINPIVFPVSDAKNLRFKPKDVLKHYKAKYPSDSLTHEMQICLSATKFSQLQNLRNVLTHRGIPPRHFDIGGETDGKIYLPINPEDPSNQWVFDFEINERTTSNIKIWLTDTLCNLLIAARKFCEERLC